MICCYNAKHNDPFKESQHPCYTKLTKVPDSAILTAASKRFSEADSDAWIDKNKIEGTVGLAKA